MRAEARARGDVSATAVGFRPPIGATGRGLCAVTVYRRASTSMTGANAPVRLRCSLLRDQGVGTAAAALARTCRGGIVEHRLPGLPEHHYLPHPGHTTSCGRRGRRRPAVVGLRHGYAGGQRGAPLRPGVPSSARARAHRGARARHRKPTGGRGRRFSSERPCRVRDTAERLCWACVARRPRTDSSLGR